jgi:SMI1-KNR4 cell-wall
MSFFTDDSYFTGPLLTSQMVKAAQASLGVRLPQRYIDLLSERNGGIPRCRCFPMKTPTSWSADHIEIAGLRGIGGEWGIDTTEGLGSADMIREWGYPDVGVVICEMPSGGHDVVMLDYRECGAEGEPAVAYVDEDRQVQQIARTFSEFIDGLISCDIFQVSI